MSDAVDRGITVTEIAAVDQPIDATPETTAAFVGRALRGPLNTPVLVKNSGDFRRRFGGSWTRSSLGPAVDQFFEHGGRALYVVRVANGARGAMICLPANGSALILRAVEPGSSESIRAAVDYDGIDPQDEEHFNLTLQRIAPGTRLVVDQEFYRRVSYQDGTERSVGEALLASSIARVDAPVPTRRPEATRSPGNRYDAGYVGHAQAGTDGSGLSDYDLIGSRAKGTGLFALDGVDQLDLVYLPPTARHIDTGPTALLAAEIYCRERHAMLIADPPSSWADAQDAVRGARATGLASPNIVAYFPRLRRRIERDGEPRVAGGAIAGLLCKLDRTYGPWFDLDQQGLGLTRKLEPACDVDDEDYAALHRAGINAVLPGPAGRARVRGGVTLARGSEAHSLFRDLAVRRLCLHIVNRIDQGTRWAVFEKHDADLALNIGEQVRAYFRDLFELGAFENDRFVVQCDAGLARHADELEHGVTLLLGFHPAGSRHAALVTLHQTARGCRVASAAFAPAGLP